MRESLNMRLGLLLASLAPNLVMGEVIVETTRNLRPFRMYEDLPARFGSGLPDEGLVGFLVVSVSASGHSLEAETRCDQFFDFKGQLVEAVFAAFGPTHVGT